jgi:putative hydrolase
MNASRFRFKRFRDLTFEDINCDLHLHTTYTDGQADVQAILRAAATRDLRCIAFTEHVRRDTAWFDGFASMVRQEAAKYPNLQTLVGCETKALDTQGSLDARGNLLPQCELVLGSVHRFPDGHGGLLEFAAVPHTEFARIEYQLAMGLVTSAPIDVLAHPGGMYARRFGRDLPDNFMRQIMLKSLERAIAIEINSSYLSDFAKFLTLCAEVNPFVSIGSDMHRLDQLGHCRDQLRAGGVGAQ